MARNPTRIGRYDLITALATGGMGRIYLARVVGIGGFERKVVIKTLEVPLTTESDPAIAMFLDEARLLGLLHHQHIASVFEVGRDDDGRHYMVLDYVEGFSAHDVWERAHQFTTALPFDFTLTVVSAAANALHYTHTRKDIDGTPLGIVHRDVTPSNVMIGHDGAVKLIDFGIAMATNRKTKTQTGFVKGKVSYLSPEQVAGRDVDARTDVFGLGILLYELTTLERAFRDSSDLATMQRIKSGKVVRPAQLVSGYPLELEAIVLKALQVDPRDRFNDADTMRRAIEALGHRLHFVLGDAAVIEVMAQLFEAHEPPSSQPPSRASDPAFEWIASENDLTVRRDPKELLEAMRAHDEGRDHIARMPRGSASRQTVGIKPRKLRAATEAADALIVQSIDAPMALPGLPLASPPPTPDRTPLPLVAAKPISVSQVAVSPVRATLSGAAADRDISAITVVSVPSSPVIGASMVRAGVSRGRTRWIAAGAALFVMAAGAGYFMTRDEPHAATGSAAPGGSPLVVPPAAARAPQVAPTAPKQPHPAATPAVPPAAVPVPPAAVTPPPPPQAPSPSPPAPAKVRVQIITHPADATVYLDGKRLGRTPIDESVDIDPGKHVVKLKRRGYAMARLDVDLSANVNEEITLTPQR